jgi:hypothetical protein
MAAETAIARKSAPTAISTRTWFCSSSASGHARQMALRRRECAEALQTKVVHAWGQTGLDRRTRQREQERNQRFQEIIDGMLTGVRSRRK